MDSFDYFEGWKYISALFNRFQMKSKEDSIVSHIAPRYIFRGISKRFFTDSKLICALKDTLMGLYDSKNKDYKYIPHDTILGYLNSNQCISTLSLSKENRNTSLDVTSLKTSELYDVIYHDLIMKIETIEFKRFDGVASEEEAVLSNIEDSKFFRYVQPEQIRSGSSVRLRDVESNYKAIADYLSYTKSLSEGFKSVKPELRSLDELEILAEIQHRGGASCLVDFSNNFLISLWFAVNDNTDDLGYLFCYDVNNDAFKKGNLSYLNQFNWNKDIEYLLRSTQNTTTYLDDNRNKFWLWRPANINGRIARQDSIFVFGIEKFYIQEHDVKIIPIPPMWKSAILKCLKVYFGITAEAVFPDIDGYANAHSKTTPLNDTTMYLNPLYNVQPNNNNVNIFDINLIQKGMSCLLKGEYAISLDFFHKALNTNTMSLERIDTLKKLEGKIHQQKIYFEIIYSIGLCYRKLKNDFKAEPYLQKAFCLGLSILTGRPLIDCDHFLINENELKPIISKRHLTAKELHDLPVLTRERVNFVNKFYKVVDEYVDTLYNTKHYDLAKEIVVFLQKIAINTCSHVVLGTTQNCLTVLGYLQKKTKHKELNSIQLNVNQNGDYTNCHLYKTIDSLSNLVFRVMRLYRKNININQIFSNEDFKYHEKIFEDSLKEDDIIKDTSSSINWYFDDIIAGIKEYFKEDKLIIDYFVTKISKIQILQDAIQCNKVV